ncbi:hypothetical protein Hypma_000103 [Hypsizygus marmoreus]|uniref:Uncharacterized protein n=1 Tax=Hypsizygus marmoreus TaxID=39966 RepID=A0A369KGV6_HYPMA|nr:hypothetical protein Hypma_000103 [Hypsizygus marmoreus]
MVGGDCSKTECSRHSTQQKFAGGNEFNDKHRFRAPGVPDISNESNGRKSEAPNPVHVRDPQLGEIRQRYPRV